MASEVTVTLGAQTKENLRKSPSKWVSQRAKGLQVREDEFLGCPHAYIGKAASLGQQTSLHLALQFLLTPRKQDWIHKDRPVFYPKVLQWVICAQDPLSHFRPASSV